MVSSTRPLGTLSDYVVEEFPAVLAQDRITSSEVARIDTLVAKEGVQRGLGSSSPLRRAAVVEQLALLDLQILRSGIIHSKRQPGPLLESVAARLSEHTRVPNILTYGQIVLTNPPTDMRSFTTGEIGATEQFFYASHRRIESHLLESTAAVDQAKALIHHPDACAQKLGEATEAFGAVHDYTRRLVQMNKAHFSAFRQYVDKHSGRDGPSGKFSPGMALIDTLFVGMHLPNKMNEIRKGLGEGYYPRSKTAHCAYVGADSVRHALNNVYEETERPLVDLVLDYGTSELAEQVGSLGHAIILFRQIHKGAANRHLTDDSDGPVSGTGGEADIAKYLQGIVAQYADVLQSRMPSHASHNGGHHGA